jgi:hypothetical protein
MESIHQAGTVVNIHLNKTQRSNKFLNEITFVKPTGEHYVAEEPMTVPHTTNFIVNKFQAFRISHPADSPGKKDWIQYIADSKAPEVQVPLHKYSIAVAAFNHVVKVNPGMTGQDLIDEIVTYGNAITTAAKML